MANIAKTKDLIISAGGSYTVESLSNYQEATVTFSTSTISSNLSINPATNTIGTVKGLKFKINYNGNLVSFGNYTVTIFGNVMDSNLRDKKLTIDLYYNGTGWDAIFTPSYSTISGLLASSNILYTSSSLISTANIAGVQVLTSFNLPKSIVKNGDRLIFKVSGRYNGSTSKNIVIQINDGTSTLNVWNLPVAYNGKDFYIESVLICTDFNNGYWSRIATINATLEYPLVVSLPQQTAPALDFTVPWTITVYGEEFTPAGSLVNIHNITVEKLLK